MLQASELVMFLTDNDEMRSCAKQSFQQGLWAGGGAIGAGFVLGPIGGLIGGIVGSVIGKREKDRWERKKE
jgi:hypothetical protein